MNRYIWWLTFKQQWLNLIFEFIAFIGSLVTICAAYFNNGFEIENWKHWLVVFLIALIVSLFVYKCYKILFTWKSLDFPKNVFFPFISEQAQSASNTIKSIAGDLSWLKKQRDTYKAIAENGIPISIYYSEDDSKLNPETKLLISEYQKFGVKMIPYPFKVETKHIKGLLIDSDENAKFFSFYKGQDNTITCSKYTWNSNEFFFSPILC